VAPDRPEQTLAALHRLQPDGVPFVVRLNRFFWSDGDAAVQRFVELTDRYTSQGFLVELQLRYHPRPDQEGDVAAFVAWVREQVARFGANPRVVAVQVTNEVNLTISPDSSDGAYAGARDALIQGVIGAQQEADARGYDHLGVGFNWFYRTDPGSEQDFWEYLRDNGGAPFVAAVDWVGLDIYPGTFFPMVLTPGGERDAIVNALSSLRECFLPIPGIPASVPVKVEENGWPTGPGRTYERQAEILEGMVRSFHDFRGTFNVSDYRWFDLRDENSSSPNIQQQYGLLRDDYGEKPAFGVYCTLVGELSGARPGCQPAPAAAAGVAPAARPVSGQPRFTG
jgi:hypothetical protein